MHTRHARPSARRSPSWRGRSLAIAALLVVASCNRSFDAGARERLLREIGETLTNKAYASGVDFGRWRELVASRRPELDSAVTPEAFANAVNELLATFEVSHLGLMAPEDARQRYAGRLIGLGVRTKPQRMGRLVLSVIEDGPAWNAGLRGGDVIVGVDGASLDSTASLAYDEPGRTVHLEFLRAGQRQEGDARIQEAPRASPPHLRWLDDSVAVLSVPTFIDELYQPERIDALFAEAGSASGLILDMRSNPGGNVDNVRHLLGHVLPSDAGLFGDVYVEEARAFLKAFPARAPDAAAVVAWLGDERYYRPIVGSGSVPFVGPLAVLIDERCGSGGELAPAVLQDLDRALLIGTPTQGRVRIADAIHLRQGFVLRIPVGEFVTVTGRAVEENPVAPDRLLTPEETARDDVILPVAHAMLTRGRAPAEQADAEAPAH